MHHVGCNAWNQLELASASAPLTLGVCIAKTTMYRPHSALAACTLTTNTTATQVAKVASVEEIDSVKLYKCTVSLGGDAVKHVMAGLKQHIAKDKLVHSLVIVITNLKPAKLAGELSEVMILAAQAPQPDSPQGEVVQVLQPPGIDNCHVLPHSSIETPHPGADTECNIDGTAASVDPLCTCSWRAMHPACYIPGCYVLHARPLSVATVMPCTSYISL